MSVIPKASGRKCLRSIISPFFRRRWKIANEGKATLPIIPPRNAPGNAPIIKIMIPPAPPATMPQNIPIKGSRRSIFSHEFLSVSRTIFPITLPEKKPTTAEIILTMATTPRIHKSSLRKPLESTKKRVNIVAGIKIPRINPNNENVSTPESGSFIIAASVFSRSERYIDFSRTFSALAARRKSNLCRVSSSHS